MKNSITTLVEVVGKDDGSETYEVHRKWGDGKKALVIELYPTITAQKPMMLDTSTMHLLNHAEELGWEDIRIVNLYSKVYPSKPMVAELEKSYLNIQHIRERLHMEDIGEYDIVIAWGSGLATHTGTSRIKKELLELIRSEGLAAQTKHIVTEYLDTQKQLGTHPLYLGLRHGNEKWSLAPFPLEAVLKIPEDKPAKTGAGEQPQREPEKKVEGKKNRGKKIVYKGGVKNVLPADE